MKKHKSIFEITFDIFNYFIFAVFAFICVFPLYYVIINSISDNSLVSSGRILFLPQGIHLSNFVEVFNLSGLFNAVFMSFARTIVGTIATVFAASFLGYTFSKREFWARKFWYRFVIVTMYFNAGLIPWYLLMLNLGMRNNFLAYILPAMCAPFSIILVKTYFESLPPSIEESAEVDGAGYIKRYLLIILPLGKPILATIAIFAAVGQWNSFMDTVYLMSDSRYYTLQFILFRYLNEAQALAEVMRRSPSLAGASVQRALTASSIRFTVTVVTVLPVLLIYPAFQRFFIKGIMIGAVKG